MERYALVLQTPLGAAPLIGATMSPEREREVAKVNALRNMPAFGLEPVEANLGKYYDMVWEVLA